MKRILFTLAGIAALIFAASCQKETGIEAGKNGNVTFTVTLPGIETKAISDGLSATKLNFAIYDGEGNYLQELTESATVSEFSGKKATVTVQVIQDLTYQFVFFAEAPGNTTYTFAPAEKKLSVNYSTANLEAVDAFYAATDKILVTGPLQKSVTLYRPLAQINVGSTVSDLAAAKLSKIDVKGIQSSYVLTDIYSELDLLTGELTGTPADVTLALAAKPEPAAADDDALILTVNGKDYGWIAMAYVLAGEKELTDVTLGVKTKNTATNADIELTRDIANVPVQRNHRTNILGNIFSQTAVFNIEIDSDFEEPDYKVIIPVWSGYTDPDLDVTVNPIIITTGEELAQLATLVNGGNTLVGKTVELANDINLGAKEWTPIGNAGNSFKGTFDGKGYTISNLKITAGLDNTSANNYKGLFGYLGANGSIKNVNIENVSVTGSLYVGGLLGRGYSAKSIENCNVTGKIEITAWWYAGGLAGRPEYMTNISNCRVDGDPGSFVKSTTGSYIGGIAGFIAEGSQRTENCYTNIDVTGVDRTGGLVGIAHYGNTINNNIVDNIVLTTLNSISSVGAIAGCANFEDNHGNIIPPTITNNTFTGIIVTSAELRNDAVVGGTYQGEDNSGNVTLENNVINYTLLRVVAAGVTTDGSGNYTVDGTEGALAAALDAIAADETNFNPVITLTADSAPLSYPARKTYGNDATQSITIDADGHVLNLYQTDSDWASLGSKNGTLIIKNATINKTKVGGNNAWNNYALILTGKVKIENSTISISTAISDEAEFTNVKINEAGGYYAVLLEACASSAKFENCTFTATNGGRGIKVIDEYVNAADRKQIIISVSGSKFTTGKKAAILVTNTAGAKITWGSGNDISGVAADSENAVWNDSNRTAAWDLVEVTGCTKFQEN